MHGGDRTGRRFQRRRKYVEATGILKKVLRSTGSTMHVIPEGVEAPIEPRPTRETSHGPAIPTRSPNFSVRGFGLVSWYGASGNWSRARIDGEDAVLSWNHGILPRWKWGVEPPSRSRLYMCDIWMNNESHVRYTRSSASLRC